MSDAVTIVRYLRARVVAAAAEGASCHRAAACFGASVSSASRWSERFRQTGEIAAEPSGGDHASHRIEAHADLILSTDADQPEIFLRALRDRLAAHGVRTSTSGLRRFFRRHRIRYVPAYSPDLNPIEQTFAKLKALLRSAATRTVPNLRAEIRKAFARFTSQECRNSIAAAVYEDNLAVAT